MWTPLGVGALRAELSFRVSQICHPITQVTFIGFTSNVCSSTTVPLNSASGLLPYTGLLSGKHRL
jgi:hypothetical protein